MCPHYTYPTPKLPTIHDTPLHTPEMQKAAVSGLIEKNRCPTDGGFRTCFKKKDTIQELMFTFNHWSSAY